MYDKPAPLWDIDYRCKPEALAVPAKGYESQHAIDHYEYRAEANADTASDAR